MLQADRRTGKPGHSPSLATGEIRYRSPKAALTGADKDGLRARRAEIVDYLETRNAAKALRGAGSRKGPLTASVAQEMWWRFAGGAEEGKPIALNIGMVGKFRARPQAVSAAIQDVIARYDALRVRFEAQDETLTPFLNPADSFEIEEEDLRALSPGAANETAAKGAQQFCARVNLIEGQWLTRAKLFALPGGESLAALSSAHMIADAGTRNIILDEIHDILDHGAPRAAPSTLYNDYSLAEREFLVTPQGAQLIEHWRRWYRDQPIMKAPSDGRCWWATVSAWCATHHSGPRADRVRVLAAQWKVTPFLIYLTIFPSPWRAGRGWSAFPCGCWATNAPR